VPASLLPLQDLVCLPLAVIGTDATRSAFADYARAHEAASIRRCRSTWKVLRCCFNGNRNQHGRSRYDTGPQMA
jgi:hypothetical protein